MSIFKRKSKKAENAASVAGTFLGGRKALNVQIATDETVEGMSLFRQAVESKQNVSFDFKKGNFFEYIEGAKFNQNSAMQGSKLRAVVTDATGRSQDRVDIEIVQDGKVVREVQAKFSDSRKAAADSVFMQKDPIYHGMQRLIRKEEHYIDPKTGEESSLLERAKALSEKAASREGNLHQKEYQDVHDNLTDELNYNGISSGGTTIEEVREAAEHSGLYSARFEHKQVFREMKCTAGNMAKASFVVSGIASGIANMFSVFSDEKTLSQAMADTGMNAMKGGVRGGVVGVISTGIRYKGLKVQNTLLSDSTVATVMANGMLDGGIALLAYTKGEIDEQELCGQLLETTAKSTVTVYFTKVIGTIRGAGVGPVLPAVVYTTANYVFAAAREILQNARLNTMEYDRLAGIYLESARAINENHELFKEYAKQVEESQRAMLDGFLDEFEYNMETGENYDKALIAIVRFAERAGITLQHETFEEFSAAMLSDETFVLS